MADVTESYPGVLPTYEQKLDAVQAPIAESEFWFDKDDANFLADVISALGRAVRFHALVTAIANPTTSINKKVFRFKGRDITAGLPDITTSLASDLDKAWAAAREEIEQGGDRDGTASATALFGIKNGPISGLAGFTSGSLLGLSSDGTLVTYIGGSLPAIGRIDDTIPSMAHIDLGGRFSVDTSELSFDSNGVLGATESATFSNLTVTGDAVFQGTVKIPGKVSGSVSFVDNVTMISALNVLGAISTDTKYLTTALAGITASTTQTQGQQLLADDINEVSMVANPNDVVTLPAAETGRTVFVKNSGANTLQVFPSSGDAIDGAVVDASRTIPAGTANAYRAQDNTTWQSLVHASAHSQAAVDEIFVEDLGADTGASGEVLTADGLGGVSFAAAGGAVDFSDQDNILANQVFS